MLFAVNMARTAESFATTKLRKANKHLVIINTAITSYYFSHAAITDITTNSTGATTTIRDSKLILRLLLIPIPKLLLLGLIRKKCTKKVKDKNKKTNTKPIQNRKLTLAVTLIYPLASLRPMFTIMASLTAQEH